MVKKAAQATVLATWDIHSEMLGNSNSVCPMIREYTNLRN